MRRLLVSGGLVLALTVTALGQNPTNSKDSKLPPFVTSAPSSASDAKTSTPSPAAWNAPPPGPAAPAAKTPAPTAKPVEPFIQDMLTILEETQSSDTFLITLELLAKESSGASTAIPKVLKNAERLGLLKDAIVQQRDDKPEVAEHILKLVQEMRDNDRGGRRSNRYALPPAPSFNSPACYPPGALIPSVPAAPVPTPLPGPSTSFRLRTPDPEPRP